MRIPRFSCSGAATLLYVKLPVDICSPHHYFSQSRWPMGLETIIIIHQNAHLTVPTPEIVSRDQILGQMKTL